jgi:hypothetical protein
MGGGGANSNYRIDISKLSDAANERIKSLADQGSYLLFVCDRECRRSLDSHLARSPSLVNTKHAVRDSSEQEMALQELDKCSAVIAFAADTSSEAFLNVMADAATLRGKRGILVRATSDAIIPSKIVSVRWPSLTWQELEEIFRS